MEYEGPVHFVDAVSRRRSLGVSDVVTISGIHATLYHGWQRNWHERIASDDPLFEPMFAVNTAVDSLRIPNSECLLDPKMAEDIGSLAKNLLLLDARISLAFYYPVDPTDGLDKKFSNIALSSEARLDPYIDRFKQIHVSAPRLVFAQPVVATSESVAQYADAEECNVHDDSVSIDANVAFSRSMVYEHGIVWSGGLLCAPSVYDLLRRDVEGNPFFFVREL